MRRRLREPSTYAGLAAIALGIGKALEAAADAAASSGSEYVAGGALIAGLIAIFAPEGRK